MPGRQNPFLGLLRGRRRKRSAGTLGAAAKEAWLSIRICSAALDAAMEQADVETVHRFVALQASVLKTYASLMVPAEIEARLQAVEARRPRTLDEPIKADDRWRYQDLIDED
jgi:hypothetical protein